MSPVFFFSQWHRIMVTMQLNISVMPFMMKSDVPSFFLHSLTQVEEPGRKKKAILHWIGEVGQTLTFGYSHTDIQTFRLTFRYWHSDIQIQIDIRILTLKYSHFGQTLTFRCSDIQIQNNLRFYRALGFRNFTTCSPYTKHGTTCGLCQFLEFSLYGNAYSRNLGLAIFFLSKFLIF